MILVESDQNNVGFINEKYRNNTKAGDGENHSTAFQDLPSVLSDQPRWISRRSGSPPRWLIS